jgi:outer membrane protein
MRWITPLVFGAVTSLSSVGTADDHVAPPVPADPVPADPSPAGIELGARLGYGLANGSLLRGYPLSDRVSGQVPFLLDAGYRFSPYVFAGIYGQYGAGVTAGCARSSCTAQDYRFGIDAIVHLRPRENVDPWLGLGIGYELLATGMLATERNTAPDGSTLVSPNPQRGPAVDVITGASDTGHSASTLQRGPEMNVQLGIDWRVGARVWIGPYAMASIGQYTHNWHDIDGAVQGDDIASTTLHEWFFIGMRATTELLGPR